MRVRVINEFRDKDNFSVIYRPGDIVNFEKHRIELLKERGLVEDMRDPLVKRNKLEEDDNK